jgi:uncharacterized membrane protein YbhN (UPF0104 family)
VSAPAGLLAILAALLVRVRRHEPLTFGRLTIEMPSVTIASLQLLASTIDLAAAAAAFWILLPHAELDFLASPRSSRRRRRWV